jgi:indole-3-glycerol phosphate synthase
MRLITTIYLYFIRLIIKLLLKVKLKKLADRVALYGLTVLLNYLRKNDLAQYIHAKHRLKQEHPNYEFP